MTAPVRILVVSPSLSQGGAERFASSLLCRLDPDRFCTHLCLLRDDITYPVPDDTTITILKKSRPWHTPRAVVRLRRTVSDWKPDVCVGTMTFTNCLISMALIGASHRPGTVARFGQNPYREFGRLGPIAVRPWARWLMGRMDFWIANSCALAESLRTYYGAEKELQTIYTPGPESVAGGILPVKSPRHTNQDTDDPPTILAVGRLKPVKRFDLLIQAFSQVREKFDCRLVICGDGPQKSTLQKHVIDEGVADQVTFLPFQTDIVSIMQRADVFAFASDYEGMPNALIEAQTMGLPAIATDCEFGPSEIIVDDETGYLVPVGDSKAFIDRLQRLLGDASLREQMGQNAAQRSQDRFGAKNTIMRWEKLFQDIHEGVSACVA